ncbi:hypothetical protein Tco_0616682 [Tanacetum coccineum]
MLVVRDLGEHVFEKRKNFALVAHQGFVGVDLRKLLRALMDVKSEIFYDFLRFLGVLITEFAASDTVNLTLKMKRAMITKKLDFEPKIDAMMRDFLE